MRKLAGAIALAVSFFALPAAACEKCVMWYDSQALRWCKDCEYAYCGYFACTVETDPDGWQWCGSAWDGEGDDQCFTYEGIAKGWCGPEEKDPMAVQELEQ